MKYSKKRFWIQFFKVKKEVEKTEKEINQKITEIEEKKKNGIFENRKRFNL